MSEPLLWAKEVRKTYLLGKRALEVLRGVDLELNRGDFLALRGASGAGKSTLLYMLGGLDVPNQGEIRLRGRNLATLNRRELARLRTEEVGFIFQAYYLLPELDALENVCLPARMARRPAAEAEAAVGSFWSGSVLRIEWNTNHMSSPVASNSGLPSPAL